MKREIASYMTSHVHTIGADRSVEEAKHAMFEFGIRHLPVLEGGKLVGIMSDRDVKLAYAIDGAGAGKLRTSDACTNEIYSVEKSVELKEVARVMAERGIGCCVITERDKVAGIFTVTDACRALSELLNE